VVISFVYVWKLLKMAAPSKKRAVNLPEENDKENQSSSESSGDESEPENIMGQEVLFILVHKSNRRTYSPRFLFAVVSHPACVLLFCTYKPIL